LVLDPSRKLLTAVLKEEDNDDVSGFLSGEKGVLLTLKQ
jgi:hypothetical protein